MFTSLKRAWPRISLSGDAVVYSLVGLAAILGPLLLVPIRGMSPVVGKGFLLAAIALLGCLALFIQSLRRGTVEYSRHPIWLAWGAILGSGLLGAFLAPSTGMALFGYGFETSTWLFAALSAALAWMSYKTVRSHDRAGMLYVGMLLPWVLLLVLHLVRFIAGPSVLTLGVLGSMTASIAGSWADLSIFFGFVAMFSVVTLELAGLKQGLKWFVGVVGAVSLAILLVMNVPHVWVILGLVSLMTALYLFSFAYWDADSSTYRKDKRMPWFALAVVIVSLAGIFFGPSINALASRHQNLAYQDVRPSFVSTAKASWASIVRNPVTGYGPNGFEFAWNKSKSADLSGANAEFSLGYGYVPTQMAAGGILGILSWLALFAAVAWSLVRGLSRGFADPVSRYFTILVSASVLYLGIILWAYVPGSYAIALFAILVGAMLGLRHASGATPERSVSFIKDPRASFFGILVVSALILASLYAGYVEYRKAASFAQYARSSVFAARGNQAESDRALANAARFASHDVYRRALSVRSLQEVSKAVSASTASTKDAVSKQVESLLGSALGHAQAAVAANGGDYANHLALGNVYREMARLGIAGARERASAAYDQAVLRNPNDAALKLAYAELAVAAQDGEGALAAIERSISQHPTADAYIARAQLQVGAKQYDAAIESMRRASDLSPYNSALSYQFGLLLFSQKQYASAAGAFERAIVANRTLGPAYVYLGATYEKMGRQEQADKVYAFVRAQFADGASAIDAVRKGLIEAPAPEEASSTDEDADAEPQP